MDLRIMMDLFRTADRLRMADRRKALTITASGSGACSDSPTERLSNRIKSSAVGGVGLNPTPTHPVPRGVDDVFQVALLGAPSQYLLRPIHGGDEFCRISRAPSCLADVEIASGDTANRLDDLANRITTAGTKIDCLGLRSSIH